MHLMRYTIVQPGGGISFVGDARLIDALVAACAASPSTYAELLEQANRFDKRVRDYVLNSLAIFDEHNVAGNYTTIAQILAETRPVNQPVFRIVDETTRQASLQPVRSGLIIFNLIDRRIVQVQNSFQEVVRSGKAVLHNGTAWTRQVYTYTLPETWSIVP